MWRKFILAVVAVWAIAQTAFSQTAFEVFGGNKKASVDVLFFKLFKNHEDENTPWLLFNRSRGVIDYRQTTTQYLPQFGLVNAISYNHKKLNGFAPVATVIISAAGVDFKTGAQLYKHIKNVTVFTWLVYDVYENKAFDYYALVRFEPKLTKKVDLFSQLELVNTFSTKTGGTNFYTQRIRVGLKAGLWQFGVGADNSQINNSDFFKNNNAGIFIRHIF
jgi:hypothetical protein